MAGIGRPGGNPGLKKHSFTTDREEPCTALLQIRVAPSLLAKLKAQDGWQEIARQAIAAALKNPAGQTGQADD